MTQEESRPAPEPVLPLTVERQCDCCGDEIPVATAEVEAVARALFADSGPHKWYPMGHPEGIEYGWEGAPLPWGETECWFQCFERAQLYDTARVMIAALDEARAVAAAALVPQEDVRAAWIDLFAVLDEGPAYRIEEAQAAVERAVRAEAAERYEQLKRLDGYKLSQLAGHHEADVLAKTLGITTVDAWGKPCPICERAIASRRALAEPAVVDPSIHRTLCAQCLHAIAAHYTTAEMDLDGRTVGTPYEQCAVCVTEDRFDSAHAFVAEGECACSRTLGGPDYVCPYCGTKTNRPHGGKVQG